MIGSSLVTGTNKLIPAEEFRHSQTDETGEVQKDANGHELKGRAIDRALATSRTVRVRIPSVHSSAPSSARSTTSVGSSFCGLRVHRRWPDF
ncbi:MAG: hypothetical protein DWH80_01390 [Planctomycetota bacterium]|nr:MAG: hypothetical protein DWH80_01390 [Planctomycetota bacterium]